MRTCCCEVVGGCEVRFPASSQLGVPKITTRSSQMNVEAANDVDPRY